MEEIKWASKHYLHLKEKGFSIDECYIDFKLISIRCDDIARYRKAFRVKIRHLIKDKDTKALHRYINTFYHFAQFAQYIYGYHSCSSEVEPWQEEVALCRQKSFIKSSIGYQKGHQLQYDEIAKYRECFKNIYKKMLPHSNIKSLNCIQDGKPFLTLKDYAHFEKWF